MPGRRGRPLKFGRPARTVAITIPEDIIETLRKTDADLGRAIVALVHGKRPVRDVRPRPEPVETAPAGRGHALIVVDPRAFPRLAGCALVPFAGDRAIITLAPGTRLADLELQVVDRLAEVDAEAPERLGLLALRRALKHWRTDQNTTITERSIIVLESAGSRGRS